MLRIHRRNLERLEIQKANLAGEVNLGLENQIDEEKANIAALAPIANPAPLPSPKIQEFVKQTTPGEIDLMMLYLQGTQVNARMTNAEVRQDGFATEMFGIKQMVLTIIADMRADKLMADSGRQRNFVLQLVNIAILLIVVAVVLALAVRVIGT